MLVYALIELRTYMLYFYFVGKRVKLLISSINVYVRILFDCVCVCVRMRVCVSVCMGACGNTQLLIMCMGVLRLI